METLGTERNLNQNQKSGLNTRKIAITALMTALETVATMFLMIPIPATSGYFNVGEAIIYFTALMFGPFSGAFVGGVGAALADLLGGYSAFAPVTFLSKGLEGYLVGASFLWLRRKSNAKLTLKKVISIILGGIVMITGYFIYESLIWGIEPALVEVPLNFLQMVFGLVIAILLTAALERYIPALDQ